MKKKLLSILLCTALSASLLVGCGGKDDKETNANDKTPVEDTTGGDTTGDDTPAGPVVEDVTAEALPETPFAHITFDGEDEGYYPVTQVTKAADSVNDGATYDIAPVDVPMGYAAGPVGNALYLDGSFGVNLGIEPTNTDQYTVSFWMNATRLSTYGATLQIGHNMGKAADVGNNVTWFNVTQSEWGADSAKIFPIVWSRNEASDAADGTDCWPWMYAFDDQIHGKKEWVHVTIVCSGEEQASPLGSTTAGAQYYINGTKVYDSADNYTNGTYFEYTWDATLAPNIMEPGDGKFEALFGINYWDTIFKGFVDDLYVYDSALTAGQVLTLYQMGDASVEAVAPTVEVEEKNPEIVAQGTLVGAPDFTTGWWKEFSEIWKVEEGQSVSKTFINYHSVEAANWNNWIMVLQNVGQGHASDPAIHADVNEAYKEYAVVRCDNWGWNSVGDTASGLLPWTLENNYDWDNFLKLLQGATVKATVTNNGTTADIVFDVTDVDGNVYYQKYSGIEVDGDVYFCLGVDGACIDVKKEAVITGTAVGATDCSTGWWKEFSEIYAVAEGETKEVNFVNYSSKGANWNNFIVVLQAVAQGHASDATIHADVNPDYKEYAVLRADNWGWNSVGDTASGLLPWTLENTYDWDNFLAEIDGASVNLKVTNNGTTADVVATITSVAGNTYTQSYKGIEIDGPLYFCLGVDGACLDIQ